MPDPEYGEHAQANEYTKPALELGTHVAPPGMAFYTGKQFTADYRNRVETVEPFISGWLNEKQQTSRGRAVDVINLPDGSILVADDYADAIYRITYN